MRMTDEQRNLAAENVNLAIFAARKFGDKRRSLEDNVGDALEALCRAAILFEPKKGTFSSYAVKAIIRAFNTDKERAKRAKRGNGKIVHVSLDKRIGESETSETLGDVTPSSCNVIDEVAGEMVFEAIEQILSKRDFVILRMLADGYRKSEIARKMGMSPAFVWQRVKISKQRIERSGIL